MEFLSIFVFIIVIIISTINVIKYFQQRSERKQAHNAIVENMRPFRIVTPEEVKRFRELHGKDLPQTSQVYRIKGDLSLLGLENSRAKVIEWSICEINIAQKSVEALKKSGVDLELQSQPHDKSLEEEANAMDQLRNLFETNQITQHELEAQIKAVETRYNHIVEFVVLNPLKKNEPVYIIAFDEWRMVPMQSAA